MILIVHVIAGIYTKSQTPKPEKASYSKKLIFSDILDCVFMSNIDPKEGKTVSPLLKEKATRIQQVLDYYYPNPPIPLNHTNGFTFLVAVVLSAQTTDGKVNEVTKELFELADTPEAMVKLETSLIQKIIQPVGLAPRKAASISGLSKMLVENFNGQVPNTFKELESLPGVGHKTASVIMSQLHGVNALAVDTHVHRLALRWGLSKEEKNVDKVQTDLCAIFPQEAWDKLHLQMIYFGREYCPAKNHKPSDCPVCCWISQPTKLFLTSDTLTTTASFTTGTTDYFAQFSPHKKNKGLVYYADRIEQLSQSPSLARYSSSSSPLKRSWSERTADTVLDEQQQQQPVAVRRLAEDMFGEDIIVNKRRNSKVKEVSSDKQSPLRRSSRKKQ